MGSGLSRSKRVAPACVVEINVSKKDATAASRPKEVRRSFNRFRTPNFTNSSNFAQVDDGHGERRVSRCTADEIGQTHHEDQGDVSRMKNGQTTSFIRSRTYGLCHFKRVKSNSGFNSTPPSQPLTIAEESHGTESGSEDVNKHGNNVFSHARKHAPLCRNNEQKSFQVLCPNNASVEQVPKTGNGLTFANCPNAPLAMPVILYDGSEEELMDTIEREFS